MPGRLRLAGWACTAALLGPLFAPAPALANGAFPSSGQILVDPTDAARVGVRATYGLVATADGGATFRWTCEAALGYSGTEHPQLAVSSEGTVFAGLLDGMVRGRLGACDWSRVASLEGKTVADVSYAVGSGRAIAAVVPAPDARGEVWASDDDAATWAKLGDSLPVKLRPLTLDAAPSDPSRLYVSGLVDGSQVRGAVARSDDGGATWTFSFVPDADASKAPYIGGIDPEDPDVVWVRLDAAPGELFVSRDGGDTWTLALLIDGFLRAFALSPDGSEVIAGGDADGLFRADADEPDWLAMTPVAARCVKWRDDAIDVCGTEAIDGFTMGRSTDDGVTFEPYYAQTCLDGPEACDEGTAVAACEDGWPAVREQIGATGCGEGGGGATSGETTVAGAGTSGVTATSGGTGDAASTAATDGPATGAGGAATGGGEASGEGDEGCSCRSTPAEREASIAGPIAMAIAAWGAARVRSVVSRRTQERRERRR